MAKIEPSLVELRGKLGDHVIVAGKKSKYIRRNTTKGSKKNEPALKKRYTATALLNRFAGELNQVIRIYCGNFKPSVFYKNLLGRFLKDASKLRLLQLVQLKGLEINRLYPLSQLGHFKTDVRQVRNKIAVSVDILSHPPEGKHNADCYYYEVLLLTWTKSKSATAHSCQLSEWIHINKGLPEFEFMFPKPAGTTQWLLCLGQRLGVKEDEIETFAAQGMKIVDVGTFDKKEQAMLNKMTEEIEIKKSKSLKRIPVSQKVRVKAKRVKNN